MGGLASYPIRTMGVASQEGAGTWIGASARSATIYVTKAHSGLPYSFGFGFSRSNNNRLFLLLRRACFNRICTWIAAPHAEALSTVRIKLPLLPVHVM